MTDMVVVANESTHRTTRYHTRECSNYPDHPREIPLSEAQERGLDECKMCSGEREIDGGGEKLANELQEIGERRYG